MCGDLEGCTFSELDALRDWEARFYCKYTSVGKLMPEDTPAAAAVEVEAATQ